MHVRVVLIKNMKSILFLLMTAAIYSCNGQPSTDSTAVAKDSLTKYNELTEQEQKVLLEKATDRPFTGTYYNKKDAGIYLCRRCNNPLYWSDDKFDSHCGWPSFDQEIEGSVTRVPDADGMRTEIICTNCKGHLGHVFLGEGFTDKDTRHCVNTSSLRFFSKDETTQLPNVIH
jgi:methionine-R-sulfoxide reductase